MLTDTAIAHFGTAARLARVLGISPAAVSQWGPEVPDLRALQLEQLTGGALRANEELPPPAAAERPAQVAGGTS